MRRPLIGLAVVIGFSALATGVSAQATGVFSDPFSLYYGLYLPRQQAIANQSTSQDLINNQASVRQESVIAAERPGLFDDTPAFAADELDPSRQFGRQRSSGRSYQNRRPAVHQQNARAGTGPPGYFGGSGSALARYHPTLTTGRSANRNIPRTRGVVGGRGMSGASTQASNSANASSYGGYR